DKLSEKNGIEVLKCKNEKDGKYYIIKIISSDELGTIRDLNHENIIKIVKKEKVRNGIWFLFFPYYTPIINEDENDARISIMFETFGELFDTCIQICNAILYIHSKKV